MNPFEYELCDECGLDEPDHTPTSWDTVNYGVLQFWQCNNPPMTATEQEVSDELADIFGS